MVSRARQAGDVAAAVVAQPFHGLGQLVHLAGSDVDGGEHEVAHMIAVNAQSWQ